MNNIQVKKETRKLSHHITIRIQITVHNNSCVYVRTWTPLQVSDITAQPNNTAKATNKHSV